MAINGLKLIAVNEAAKGLFVLLAGAGVLEYAHRHLDDLGDVFLKHAGLGHASEVLGHLLSGLTDKKILWLAAAVAAYSLLRFIEAYGLWFEQNWARWFGAITGGLYLPYEFYLLFEHFTGIKLVITLINVAIVIYLLVPVISHRAPKAA